MRQRRFDSGSLLNLGVAALIVGSMIFMTHCLAGCGGEREVPSCSQAFSHYYKEAGCGYVNVETGDPIPEGEAIVTCRDLLRTAPEGCLDVVEDWIICHDSTPSPAETDGDCDCSRELEDILVCR